MIVTISKDRIKKVALYNNAQKLTASKIQKNLGCQYLLNAGLFNISTFKPVNNLTIDNVVLSKGGSPYGYAIKGNNVVFSYENNVKYPSFIGAYPCLVRNGAKEKITPPAGLDGYRWRSAMGLKANGDIVLLCEQSNRSLDGIADDLLTYGCVNAINFDGGGSSQCYFDGKSLASSRIVNNYICIYTQNVTPDDTKSNKIKICLDAGHGETCTNGAPDKSYYEHEFAMDMSKRLEESLKDCGFDVGQTRRTGVDIGLNTRCEIANKWGSDYYISLHTNAVGTSWSTANGIETYVVGKGGKAEALANAVQKALVEATEATNRGVKTANYAVLKGTDCPAILIEFGFHTNKADVAKLKTSAYRDTLAKAVAKGVCKYLDVVYKEEATTEKPSNANTISSEYVEKWIADNKIDDVSKKTTAATHEDVWNMLYRYREVYGGK